MRIGELSRRTGATPRSLRLYEQAGLIASLRSPNGYRWYDESTVVRVRNIRHLLHAGLTLDDVQAFVPCLDGDVSAAPPSAEGVRIARERLRAIDVRIAAQQDVRDRLAERLDSLTTYGTGPRPG